MRLTAVGTEVTVAGLTVRPGDLLHADEHGVLQIPAEALPGIIGRAELIRQDEQNIVGWSRSADFSVGKLLRLRRGSAQLSVPNFACHRPHEAGWRRGCCACLARGQCLPPGLKPCFRLLSHSAD